MNDNGEEAGNQLKQKRDQMEKYLAAGNLFFRPQRGPRVQVQRGSYRKNEDVGEDIKSDAVKSRAPVECFKSVVRDNDYECRQKSRPWPSLEQEDNTEHQRLKRAEEDQQVYPRVRQGL